jgi:hypothetical protein
MLESGESSVGRRSRTVSGAQRQDGDATDTIAIAREDRALHSHHHKERHFRKYLVLRWFRRPVLKGMSKNEGVSISS